MTSTAAALRAGLLLSRRLDNDVVLEDGRAEDGHVAPPLVELSHLEGLFKDGAALVNVLRVKNLQKTIRYVFRLMVPTKKKRTISVLKCGKSRSLKGLTLDPEDVLNICQLSLGELYR